MYRLCARLSDFDIWLGGLGNITLIKVNTYFILRAHGYHCVLRTHGCRCIVSFVRTDRGSSTLYIYFASAAKYFFLNKQFNYPRCLGADILGSKSESRTNFEDNIFGARESRYILGTCSYGLIVRQRGQST